MLWLLLENADIFSCLVEELLLRIDSRIPEARGSKIGGSFHSLELRAMPVPFRVGENQ
ncbi:hypothetical protein HNR39_000875 [Glaciimonas immobilis]|uniref:Uncharacterized protein n=1 Tax=Glaciimonas immobilis TaxID=728004 RepID=A0A840RN04_9BURK|nr:hypothetical protein [Glaciimonas immobilis]